VSLVVILLRQSESVFVAQAVVVRGLFGAPVVITLALLAKVEGLVNSDIHFFEQ
jgi:hypothetical protein